MMNANLRQVTILMCSSICKIGLCIFTIRKGYDDCEKIYLDTAGNVVFLM